MVKEASAFLRFGLAGAPGFLIAVPLNFALIEWAHWPKPLAYLLVAWMQMTSGFLMCHYLVFKTAERRSLFTAYGQFAASMATIRAFDWATYSSLVMFLHVPFVLAQIACAGFFLLLKFVSAKAIFRPRISA
jgi:putative flippase GtrA